MIYEVILQKAASDHGLAKLIHAVSSLTRTKSL
jgi:hypothetical protein